MQLATLSLDGTTSAAHRTDAGWVLLPGFADVRAVLEDPRGPHAVVEAVSAGTVEGAGSGEGASAAVVPESEARLVRPVREPRKVFCIGLNYRNHILEVGMELPTYPTVFTKFARSLAEPGADILAPAEDERLDYEGELVLVIGKEGRRIPAEQALDHVAGYTVGNDFSMRGYQLRTEEWGQGKMWEASSAVGPVVVTTDEFDPAGATLTTRVNGEVRQQDSTGDLVFGPADLVSYLSTIITLEPGDLVFTGTPGGVGMATQTWLEAGDEVTVEIDGIGAITNRLI
ncbi:fumarylacetoacetate hydrolase family protein [Brevibacterium litoralis]|uniref:fumarylacetoacetate hydrolase family protein n=1 Tax=Brevibacterium litoralis TaxID=3138935 RepID=UPI0032ECCF82